MDRRVVINYVKRSENDEKLIHYEKYDCLGFYDIRG
jgi:hypothetical protein